MRIKVFIFFFLFKTISSNILNEDDQIFNVPLDRNDSVSLHWLLDYARETIYFEIHLLFDFGWFAFGFSERGNYHPADYCVLWFDWKNEIHFQDTFSDPFGVLKLDQKQDCKSFNYYRKEGRIFKFVFERKFDTCDVNDYIIQDGTVHLVWSRGPEKPYKLNGLNISTIESDKGMVRVQLLKNNEENNIRIKSDVILDILANKVRVPNVETTYWCHVHKLDQLQFAKKHHIVQYEPIIEEGNEALVHHMEIYHCEAPFEMEISSYVGPCFDRKRPESTQVCKRVLAAWAMGAKPFKYPLEAGLPLGGPQFNPHIMLEIHYNNPEKRTNWIDSSGMRFRIDSKLRKMDAGVMEIGLEYTDKMAIPPGQNQFDISAFCTSECTAISLPEKGITVFASQLHTHLTGIKVITRHVRDGIELLPLNQDLHYSTHFQEIRKLKKAVKILPGDALITTCTYNTEERENVTLGGFAISDEMCVNYIHYFPKTNLEVCKSAISDQALLTYFNYMKRWENQGGICTTEGISHNYKAIEWNPMRVEFLNNLYKEAPLSMQCNMSSGDRFPGYWENSPITPISFPLPPPEKNCDIK